MYFFILFYFILFFGGGGIFDSCEPLNGIVYNSAFCQGVRSLMGDCQCSYTGSMLGHAIGNDIVHSKITMAGNVVPYYIVTAQIPTLR